MEILKKIDDLLIGWGISPSRADMLDQFIAFALILAVAFLADALCRKILLKVVAQLVKKTKATWDDIVFDRKVMVHLSRMVAPVIIYLFVPLAFVEVGSSAMDFIRRICLIYIIITFLSFVNSFLKAVYSVYSEKEQFRDRPLKGMLQTMQVILWLVGGIVVVGELIGPAFAACRIGCFGSHPDAGIQGFHYGLCLRCAAFGQRHAEGGRLD